MFIHDQLNRALTIAAIPQRIISLVPSQTELLSDLGLDNEVVGITKFCIHPAVWHTTKTRVGGTKTINNAAIASLHPDLILANKEENNRQDLEWLMERFPVWISDVKTLNDALSMLESVGQITGRSESAEQLVDAINRRFGQITLPSSLIRTAYLIWNDPYMSINDDTFIDHMLKVSGLINVFAARSDSRYPIVSADDLIAAQPELVLLSSEPFPFGEKHIRQLSGLLPNAKIMLADGAMFSWYGSRLLSFDPSPYRV